MTTKVKPKSTKRRASLKAKAVIMPYAVFKSLQACGTFVEEYKKEFNRPLKDGIELTPEFKQFVIDKFSLTWASNLLPKAIDALSEKQLTEFVTTAISDDHFGSSVNAKQFFKSLPKKEHIDIVEEFAQDQYDDDGAGNNLIVYFISGDPKQRRKAAVTYLEHVLREYCEHEEWAQNMMFEIGLLYFAKQPKRSKK